MNESLKNRLRRIAEGEGRRPGPGPAPDPGLPIAMAYVPEQVWRGIIPLDAGLSNGTVFEELIKPFCAAGRRKAL